VLVKSTQGYVANDVTTHRKIIEEESHMDLSEVLRVAARVPVSGDFSRATGLPAATHDLKLDALVSQWTI
jgi:hypothetical protein